MTHEPDNNAPRMIPEAVAQAAAEWVMRCDRGLNLIEERLLAEWLAADPDHKTEYARLQGQWRSLDAVKADPSLLAMADAVEVRAKNRSSRRKWYFQLAALGLAAAAAVAIVLVSSYNTSAVQRPAPVHATLAAKSYVVLASTVRRMDLPDGSVAELNGDSRIEVNFSDAVRQVKLLKGEALFSVAKNPARPFVVSAGPVSVRAVGTAFSVVLSPSSVKVLVTEGKVHLGDAETSTSSVSPPALVRNLLEAAVVAGERAIVQTNASAEMPVSIDTPSAVEIERALAWKSTQLVFDHTPLDEVVAAFNKYSVRRLVLVDASLKSRTLTGSFSAENLEGFTRLLRPMVDVVAEPRGDDEILLRPAP